MYELLQYSFAGLAICFLFIIFVTLNHNFNHWINSLFVLASACTMLLMIVEFYNGKLAALDSPTFLRTALQSATYPLRCAFPYLILLISRAQNRLRKADLLLGIPFFAMLLISASALFSSAVFHFDESNHFIRGSFAFLPYLIIAFYFVLLLWNTLQNYTRTMRNDSVYLLILVALLIAALVLEFVMDGHVKALVTSFCAYSLVFYYLLLYSNKSNCDFLTGCLNRGRYYHDARSRYLTAVIALDLNGLKYINDTQGHSEGDEALSAMAESVTRCLGKRALLYRIGGDEFAILCFRMTEDGVKELLERVRGAMEYCDYTWASGYAMHNPKEGFDTTCLLADAAMYENKVHMRQQTRNYFRKGGLSMG